MSALGTLDLVRPRTLRTHSIKAVSQATGLRRPALAEAGSILLLMNDLILSKPFPVDSIVFCEGDSSLNSLAFARRFSRSLRKRHLSGLSGMKYKVKKLRRMEGAPSTTKSKRQPAIAESAWTRP